MEVRAPLYEALADFTIATDGRKVHLVADAIYGAFKAAQETA
jgi:shikimate kinase